MRISTAQIYNNLLSGISSQQNIQNRGNAQISSGTRFQTPAQAGLDYKVSLDIRHAQTGITGSIEAVSLVENRLTISQTMLSDMNNVLTRAQSLAVQQADATVSASQRASAAVEVSHLISRFFDDANLRWQGQSVFGGTAVDQPAFISNAFNAGTAVYTAGANTSITAVTQSLNPNAVNDSYAITLDAAGTSITGITNAADTNLLAAPVALATGANAVTMSNGVALSISYNGVPDTVNQAAGNLTVSGALVQDTVTYNGNSQNRTVAVTPEQVVVSNVRGDNPAFTDAFTALKAFKDALNANDVTGIQNALGALTSAGDKVINLTTDVGGQLSAMKIYRTSYEDLKLQLDKQMNTHEAVDIPAVMAELQQSSIALQAAYSQIAQIKSLSLTNYLR
ncbi:MAG: flagellar hook-associated protein 3 [Zetaproteobacteria bacterium CG1_02_53_45]|nr:MAG: flagellar hook-associated protein 3 [Zetaproteobacteria bacterium CG1_02_53_45]